MSDPTLSEVKPELTTDRERNVLRRLLDAVADRSRREVEIETRHRNEVAAEQEQFNEVFRLVNSTRESEAAELYQRYQAERSETDLAYQTQAASTEADYRQILRDAESRLQSETEAAQKERDEAGWLVGSLLDEDTDGSPRARLQVIESGMTATRVELEAALQSLDHGFQKTTTFLQRSRLLAEATPPEPTTLPVDMSGLQQSCLETVRQSEPLQGLLLSRLLPRAFCGYWPLVGFTLLSLLLYSVIRSFVAPPMIGLRLEATGRDWQLIAAAAGLTGGLALMFLLHAVAGMRTIPHYEKLQQAHVDAHVAFDRWQAASRRELERQENSLADLNQLRLQKRDEALARADDRLQERRDAATRLSNQSLKEAHLTYPARLTEVERNRQLALQRLDARYDEERQNQLFGREQDSRHLQTEFDSRTGESRKVYQQSWLQLIHDWRDELANLAIESDSLLEQAQSICPDWSTVLQAASEGRPIVKHQPTSTESTETDFASGSNVLSFGRIIADLSLAQNGVSSDPRLKYDRTRFDVPLLLPLRNKPSLVVHTNPATRELATSTLQVVMLRYLTALPAGSVRFTILDPVGLGANFGSFMHLADIDEQLVTSRIWTEPTHIERRLADLTEHMETVLQGYLRNEYASLDDYNRDAGEVAEPYRVLVIANFPANFTDVALRRLMSIAEGGVRCGVSVLLSIDESVELPRGFSLADLEKHATVLRLVKDDPAVSLSTRQKDDLLRELEREQPAIKVAVDTPLAESPQTKQNSHEGHIAGRTAAIQAGAAVPFSLDDPDFRIWPLHFDQPPDAEDFGMIVRHAGELARNVRRVEVPFSRVMPSADSYWTSSARSGLDIPIGRAGATKHQHVRLGKGTSQHVLVAGKTGSGKSSLLHALITNAALHYSPDELEFYLIDFKKGVEFKTYATERLPHARVIAIESDREFGVSVLQRLDQVLKERGERFRQAGVQDIAGYRDVLSNRFDSTNADESIPADEWMPRILLIIDEFQEFFIEDDALSQQASLLLDRLIRQGRAFGVHVMLGSQTLAGAYSLARSTLGQIAVRIALQCSDTDSHLILSEDNTAARLLSRPGDAIYNDANGLVEGNHPFQVVWLDDAQRTEYLGWLRAWADEYSDRLADDDTEATGIEQPRWPDPIVFEGNTAADPAANSGFISTVRDHFRGVSRPTKKTTRSCWLGEAVSLSGPLELQFGPRDGGPVLIVGRDEEAALGLMTSCITALAAQDDADTPLQDRARFFVLDGSLPDSASHHSWDKLAGLFPAPSFDGALTENSSSDSQPSPSANVVIQHVSPRGAAIALQEVVDIIRSRVDELSPPVFVVIHDMARFRELKKTDDDFGGFGGFDKEKSVSPFSLWTEIVKEGPAVGVFPIVWCDGYAAVQRGLGRDLLNRFETRILFTLNANDSSNLIDNPVAAKLGQNRAILSRGDIGSLEKFRPYRTPSFDSLLPHTDIPAEDAELESDATIVSPA